MSLYGARGRRVTDPLAHTPWSAPGTVAGFARGLPNEVLMRVAASERDRVRNGLAIDIGCGAARNAVALAQAGWRVMGTDLSAPMLTAARDRVAAEAPEARAWFALAPMDALPIATDCGDLVIAHGIWNLARSGQEFRCAVAEAARVARRGAPLFVFTFSRNTFPAETRPVGGETFVFTEFSGQPQCFLTAEQLIDEVGAAGFALDPGVPVSEYNRRADGTMALGGPPVIYEALFRKR
jgi:SAM-dependent methyltransferase